MKISQCVHKHPCVTTKQSHEYTRLFSVDAKSIALPISIQQTCAEVRFLAQFLITIIHHVDYITAYNSLLQLYIQVLNKFENSLSYHCHNAFIDSLS